MEFQEEVASVLLWMLSLVDAVSRSHLCYEHKLVTDYNPDNWSSFPDQDVAPLVNNLTFVEIPNSGSVYGCNIYT